MGSHNPRGTFEGLIALAEVSFPASGDADSHWGLNE
jgi:hypothetical protein